MSRVNPSVTEAGSAFWMARVARAAQALSEVEALAKKGICSAHEVNIAKENYVIARQMYTNPFGIPKGHAA